MSHTIPTRDQVDPKDTWDLSILFKSREEWDAGKEHALKKLDIIRSYEGTLKEDSAQLLRFMKDYYEVDEIFNRLISYAQLEYSADSSSNNSQELMGTINSMLPQVETVFSFVPEELSNLSDEFLSTIIDDENFKDYKQEFIQIKRNKKHILSKKEENLLAQQSAYSRGFHQAFSALTDIDMQFGEVETKDGTVAISQASIGVLLENEDRNVRKTAYEKFHTEFNKHINTLSCLYTANVQKDNAMARIRNYESALQAKLYKDNVPLELYHNLIEITHKYLPVLHKYYALLKKKLAIDDYALYDTSAKPFPAPEHNMPYEEAVDLVYKACAPLGEEYTRILRKGLLEDRWVDKYENKGKRSGAFSMEVYGAYPYIMMNYQSKSLNHVFTLAHEAGHSMHSHFASEANPYSQHNYTIFEAEVASTVNEFLLYRHLIKNTGDETMKAYLLWHEMQDFIGTFFRQTMFAEFEIKAHEHADQGKALTVQFYKDLALQLYAQYSGEALHIPELSGILGLRIPHFYSSYYVYKYATGIAAAVDIGTRIFAGEDQAVENYFAFLRSGGSRFPIDALKLAGVDYTSTRPIENALKEFERKYELLSTIC